MLNLFKKKKPYYQKKTFIIPLGIIVFLIALRIILPSAIKIGLNTYLKDFSPSLSAHVEDVDLAILRGVYTIEGITAEIKKDEHQFLSVDSAQASLAWRNIFKGHVIADILVNKLDFNYAPEVLTAVNEHIKKMKEDKDDDDEEEEDDDDKKDSKKSSFNVGRFDLRNSIVRTSMFKDLTLEQGIVITKLEARATNLIPSELVPLTPFSLQALILGSGKLKVEGEANLLNDKPAWTVDGELKDFKLPTLNHFLKNRLPLTFTRGELDLYAEAASETGPIKGYVKPFITDLDVIKKKEKFLGPKHWLIEVISALGNVVMESRQTMATRVPFIFDTEFKPDARKAISKAFEHGFKQELNRGIENSISLNRKYTIQSQEEKQK